MLKEILAGILAIVVGYLIGIHWFLFVQGFVTVFMAYMLVGFLSPRTDEIFSVIGFFTILGMVIGWIIRLAVFFGASFGYLPNIMLPWIHQRNQGKLFRNEQSLFLFPKYQLLNVTFQT